jgi:FkbM family methyltransferase
MAGIVREKSPGRWELRAFVLLAWQSLGFDAATLLIGDLPLRWRIRFLFEKYLALCRFARGSQPELSVGNIHLLVDSISSLGTLQSNIVDFYRVIVRTGLLREDRPMILDVGANVGQFCLAAKLFYPSATVQSFEADPETFEMLRQNVGNIPGVTLHNVALASRDGDRTFFRHTLSAMSSFRPYPGHSYTGASKEITLSTRRLDDVVEEGTSPDLVKIDVEGYEMEVINGGTAVLSSTRLLLVELRLCSSPEDDPNLDLFNAVSQLVPHARLIRCGRPLGPNDRPVSQDVLFDLSLQEAIASRHGTTPGRAVQF